MTGFSFIDENGNEVMLNLFLAKKQGLKREDRINIIKEHKKRVKIFKQMIETEDKDELRSLATKVEEIEFRLQTFWRFEPNKKYHTWWDKVPHCKCMGTTNRYDLEEHSVAPFKKIMADCIIHGD